MKPLRDFDYDTLRKGLAGEFAPRGPFRQSCHKMNLRGLMDCRQGILEMPFRRGTVKTGTWFYWTTQAGKAVLTPTPPTPPRTSA